MAADLLRLALTLSSSVYEDRRPAAAGWPFATQEAPAPRAHAGFLFEDWAAEAAGAPELRVWTDNQDYPWAKNVQFVSSLLTCAGVDSVADLKCDLYYNVTNRALFVSFRGTHTMENALTDLMYVQEIIDPEIFRPPVGDGSEGSVPVVHSGFHAAYLSMRPRLVVALRSALRKFPECKDVYCVGHSLGGALATLAALDLSINRTALGGSTAWNPAIVTFGAPMVGNQALASYVMDAVPVCVRVVNRLDPVPHSLDAAKLAANWLEHNHEPYAHAASHIVTLEFDAYQETKNALTDAWRAWSLSTDVLSVGIKALGSKAIDQHGRVGYVQALESHIQRQVAQNKHVLEPTRDPNLKLKAVVGFAGGLLQTVAMVAKDRAADAYTAYLAAQEPQTAECVAVDSDPTTAEAVLASTTVPATASLRGVPAPSAPPAPPSDKAPPPSAPPTPPSSKGASVMPPPSAPPAPSSLRGASELSATPCAPVVNAKPVASVAQSPALPAARLFGALSSWRDTALTAYATYKSALDEPAIPVATAVDEGDSTSRPRERR